jgi:hypothetical protein
VRKIALVIAIVCAPGLARADEPLGYGANGIKLGDKVLFDGPVSGAAYDAAQDLVWFRTAGTLEVIDLRDPALAPVKIVTKLPEEGGFAIRGASKAGYLDWPGAWVISYPVLTVGKTVKLKAHQEGDFGDNGQDDDDARYAIKHAKIVGKKWLKALAKRKRHAVAPSANVAGAHVDPPDPEACEDAPDQCGVTTTLGATPYLVVVVAASPFEEDVYDTSCLLYDPAKKRWIDPNQGGEWSKTPPDPGSCDDYDVSADGTRYLTGTAVCTLAKKTITCEVANDVAYLAWITLPND